MPPALQSHFYTLSYCLCQTHIYLYACRFRYAGVLGGQCIVYVGFLVFCRRPITLSCDRSWRKSSTLTDSNVPTSNTCPGASRTCSKPASACSWRSDAAHNPARDSHAAGSALSHTLNSVLTNCPLQTAMCLPPLLDMTWFSNLLNELLVCAHTWSLSSIKPSKALLSSLYLPMHRENPSFISLRHSTLDELSPVKALVHLFIRGSLAQFKEGNSWHACIPSIQSEKITLITFDVKVPIKE